MDDPFSKIIGVVGIVGVPLAIVTWVVTKFIPSLFTELKVQRDSFLAANKEQQAAFLVALNSTTEACAKERLEFEKQVVGREEGREAAVEKRLANILLTSERREEKMNESFRAVINALNTLSELLTGKLIREEVEGQVERKKREEARHREKEGKPQ